MPTFRRRGLIQSQDFGEDVSTDLEVSWVVKDVFARVIRHELREEEDEVLRFRELDQIFWDATIILWSCIRGGAHSFQDVVDDLSSVAGQQVEVGFAARTHQVFPDLIPVCDIDVVQQDLLHPSKLQPFAEQVRNHARQNGLLLFCLLLPLLLLLLA